MPNLNFCKLTVSLFRHGVTESSRPNLLIKQSSAHFTDSGGGKLRKSEILLFFFNFHLIFLQAEWIHQEIKSKLKIFPLGSQVVYIKPSSGWFDSTFQKFICVVSFWLRLICILPTKENTPKDNKQRNRSEAVKHLSRLKRAAFYPQAITITSSGRTIKHSVIADGGCRCFFPFIVLWMSLMFCFF